MFHRIIKDQIERNLYDGDKVLTLYGPRQVGKTKLVKEILKGRPVSLNEIGRAIGMSQETVTHYIDLLEKGFVLFRMGSYSNNPGKEITKMNKIYFHDLGPIPVWNSINYVEQDGGQLHGYKFKFGKPAKAPASWEEAYPGAAYSCIHQENFASFVANP